MVSISKIYITNEKHRHISVSKNYLFERKLKFKDITIPVYYCNICDIHMCSKETYEKYKENLNKKLFKKININDYIEDTCYIEDKLNGIRLNKESSFEKEHKEHSKENRKFKYMDKTINSFYCSECDSYGIKDSLYDFIKNGIIYDEPISIIRVNNTNNYDLRNNFNFNHMSHNVYDKIIKLNDIEIRSRYCEDCDMYSIKEDIFYKYFSNDFAGRVIYNQDNKKISIPKEINFFIKMNSFRCKSLSHSIEEVTAIVKVFDKIKEEIIDVEINAYYCNNCNLYYIYESEYKLLLRYGIPTCPIYEEIKYYNSKKIENYSSESLLRQFGYNVNSQEDLSNYERQKTIKRVIENGIMSKNEVLSLLNFLVSSRKNLLNMQNAVSKWKKDIEYTRELKVDNVRKVEVGAFRKIINIHKI